MRNGNIYWIAGARDGIGKWMLATAVIELWIDRSRWPLVIDCDVSNTGEPRRYVEQAEIERIGLDTGSGWMALFDLCERNRKRPIVVRTVAGRTGRGPRFGQAVHAIALQLERSIVALWVIDRSRESLEGLKTFVTAMPATVVHVVCNGYFGEVETFDEYHHSRLRGAVEGNGGRTIWLPKLDECAALHIGASGLAASSVSETAAELCRWLTEAKRALEAIVVE